MEKLHGRRSHQRSASEWAAYEDRQFASSPAFKKHSPGFITTKTTPRRKTPSSPRSAVEGSGSTSGSQSKRMMDRQQDDYANSLDKRLEGAARRREHKMDEVAAHAAAMTRGASPHSPNRDELLVAQQQQQGHHNKAKAAYVRPSSAFRSVTPRFPQPPSSTENQSRNYKSPSPGAGGSRTGGVSHLSPTSLSASTAAAGGGNAASRGGSGSGLALHHALSIASHPTPNRTGVARRRY